MDKMRVLHDELQELLRISTEVAYKDSQITDDEARLLGILGKHLALIETELITIIDSIDDDLSEEELRKRLRLIAQDIMPTLSQAAEDDGLISADEAAILSRVLNEIM